VSLYFSRILRVRNRSGSKFSNPAFFFSQIVKSAVSSSLSLVISAFAFSGSAMYECHRTNNLVGALGLDVTGLLALVASSLGGGLGGAVAGEMADFAAVVALLALGAVTWTC